MGLIMLILCIAPVPTAYALNHAVTGHDIRTSSRL